MKTLLVTGFEPFPGMPVNPTSLLVERLPKRLPGVPGVAFHFALLPTTWAGRQEVSAQLRLSLRPDAIVHLGVDGKRRTINVETRAVNRATRIRPDAAGQHALSAPLDRKGPSARCSTLPARALQQAAQRTGMPARLSTDAGDYLCNATLWDSIASGIPSIFIHVPSLPRGRAERRPSLQQVEASIAALLMETAKRI